MSAFLVSCDHINALLHFYKTTEATMHSSLGVYPHGSASFTLGEWNDDATWLKAAQLLRGENHRSLRAKYGNRIEEEAGFSEADLRLPIFEKPLSPVQILKLCQCYDYQACESKDYGDTAAKSLVSAIKSAAIATLPGYEEAHWSIQSIAEGRTPKARRIYR